MVVIVDSVTEICSNRRMSRGQVKGNESERNCSQVLNDVTDDASIETR